VKCPVCGGPLEELLMPNTLAKSGVYGCFNGCKHPDNRWKVEFGGGWVRAESAARTTRGVEGEGR